MVWKVTSYDTTTGDRLEELQAEDYDWDRKLSAGAGQSCIIPIDGSGFTKTQLRNLTAHWSRTLVLENDNGVVAGGIVRRRRIAGRKILLSLTDLWGLWERRGGWGDDPRPGNLELWSISYTNLSRGTLAKRAVQRGTAPFSGEFLLPEPGMPITFPADESGDIDLTYYGYNLEYVADVLDDLLMEGLDIDFRPRIVDGKLDWHMRNDPNSNLWEWEVNAEDGGVSNFEEDSDGARMTNNGIIVGEGQGTEMLARSNRDVESGLPLLERLESRKSVSDAAQASRMSTRLLSDYKKPTESWNFDVLASGTPKVQDLRLGDTARLGFYNDVWQPDGKVNRRITRITGGMREKVTIYCQSTGGA